MGGNKNASETDGNKNGSVNEPPTPLPEGVGEPVPGNTTPTISISTTTPASSKTTTHVAPTAAPRTWKRTSREERATTDKAEDGQGATVESCNNLKKDKEGGTLVPAVGGSVLGKRQEGVEVLLDATSDSEKRSKKRMGIAKDDAAGDGRKEEATSPGATGTLTGATDGACQSP